MNRFGTNLRLTTFGESHGPAIGGVIDGFPAGFKINFDKLQEEIDKRKPGTSLVVTQRRESDIPEFLSGVNEDGVTLGTPIGFIIRNKDNHSNDYSEIKDKYRPNHADYTYESRYGIRDHRGGGRASARETANWVVAGSLANQWLSKKGIEIFSVLSSVGSVKYTENIVASLIKHPFDTEILNIPPDIKNRMNEEILMAKNEGDSVGGIVTGVIIGLNPGVGNPVADKLHARLGNAMLTINAAKGFEYGVGMEASNFRGSQTLDIFKFHDGKIITETNFSGGIQGGISNGMPIFFNVAFKPTPTLLKEIETLNNIGEKVNLKMKGRHDPCVAVRAVPVVKAMASLVIADFLL